MSSESATKKTTWKKRKPDVQQAAQCWDQVPRDTAEKSKDHAEWELWATLQGKKPDVSSHLGHACSPASTRVTGPFVCLLINYALVCSCCCCCYCWVASVVSDSVQPHWRPPPGSSVPGILQARKMECIAISFSNAWKWKVKVKSLSRVRLLATPWTAAYQAPLPMRFSRSGVACHCLLLPGGQALHLELKSIIWFNLQAVLSEENTVAIYRWRNWR